MTEPLVSVCMPVYNAGKYVAEALDSVLGQSYRNIEVIAVNDGSRDNSADVLEVYRKRGVKVIHQENRGQCAAANRAYAEARGEYIKFFDADDILSPRFIEAQVKRLAGRTDAIASAKWGRFYNDDLATFRLNPEPVWKDMRSEDWLVEAWMDARAMMQCALWLIPRQVLEKVGGWDEKLSLINDFEFFARVLCGVEDVLFCESAVLYYRSGMEGSLSAQKSRKARESECESVLSGTKHLLARRSDLSARIACANACLHLVHDLYPEHGDLRRRLENRIASCGPVATIEPTGGRYFNLLRPLVGWKLARRLQRCVGR